MIQYNFLWIYSEILYICLVCWNEFCESNLIWLDFFNKALAHKRTSHSALVSVVFYSDRRVIAERASGWTLPSKNQMKSPSSWRDDMDITLCASHVYDMGSFTVCLDIFRSRVHVNYPPLTLILIERNDIQNIWHLFFHRLKIQHLKCGSF